MKPKVLEINSLLDALQIRVGDAISFYYYDCLCKTEPKKLLALKLKLQACS
ncbi:hypothetical protein [Eubacterium sp.]